MNVGKLSRGFGLFVLALAAAMVVACGGGPGTVEGTVTRDGEALADAQVVVFQLTRAIGNIEVYQKGAILRETRTDGEGRFSFTLEADKYVIEVWMDGDTVANRMVDVESGRSTRLDLAAEPAAP
jgi:hypothetical protein